MMFPASRTLTIPSFEPPNGAIVPTIDKHSRDSFTLTLRWSPRLAGDPLASAALELLDDGGLELGLGAPTIGGQLDIVTFMVSGGVAGRAYRIRSTVTTEGGNTFSAVFGVRVKPE